MSINADAFGAQYMTCSFEVEVSYYNKCKTTCDHYLYLLRSPKLKGNFF